jgi:hypothetical protein
MFDMLIDMFVCFCVMMMIDEIFLCVCNCCLIVFNDDDDDKNMCLMKFYKFMIAIDE